MNNAELFWNRVKNLIKSQNTKQESVAINSGISYRTLQTWINRKTFPDAIQAAKIAENLNTTVEYLVTGKNQSDLPDDINALMESLSRLSVEVRKPIIISALAQVKAMQELFSQNKNLKNGTSQIK